MASWKKVIVSGSQASLAGLSGSLLTDGKLVFSKGDEGALTSVSGVDANSAGHLDGIFSGSFSGSFEGDGGNLTNLSLDNSLTDGNGIADFTFDGSAAAVVSVDSGSLAGDGLTTDGTGFLVQAEGSTLSVGGSGVKVADEGIDTLQLATGSVESENITNSNVLFAKIQDVNSMTVIGRTASGTGVTSEVSILDEDGMASNSDTALATQQSIKAYVDAQVGGATLHVSGSTGAHALDLNDGDLQITGSDGIITSASIDGNDVFVDIQLEDAGIANAKLANSTFQVQGGSGLTGGGSATSLGSSDTLAVGAGLGITVNDDDVAVNTGSTHFTEGVREKISVTDTAGASGINMTYDQSTGAISGVLNQSAITFGTTAVNLGETVTRLDITDASGSFSGSFEGDGSGLTGLVTNLSISSSANNGVAAVEDAIDLKSEGLIFAGTDNEVKVEASATAQGNTVTVGLPTNVTIQGDLTVLGTRTELNVEDLVVEDRFIYLASGSSGATDGGIIVEGAGDSDGAGFGWDQSEGRWGFDNTMASGSDTITPSGYAAAVVTSDTAAYQKVGNIRIDTSTEDIYIYS